MKNFRSIISLILAAAMIFGCTSVFASAAHPDEIYNMWDDVYYYDGEMSAGENTVTANKSYSGDYFSFNAENEGYYVFSYDDEGAVYDICVLSKYYGVSFYEEIDGVIDNNGYALLYLEDGENYIGVWFESDMENSEKISVEYAGKEINGITFDAGAKYPLVLDCDITDDSYEYMSITGFSLTFDSEKTVDFPNVSEAFEYYAPEGIKVGENEVEIIVGDKRFPKTLTVAQISDYIEKVELADGGMSEIVYYDGSAMGTGLFKFRITYTDGTVITVSEYDEISLRNGSPSTYTLYCNCYRGEGRVQIGRNNMLSFTYDVKDASFTENLGLFFSNLGNEFNYIRRIPEKAEELSGQDSAADTLRAFGEFVSFVNNNFFYAIGDIFEHLVLLFATIS